MHSRFFVGVGIVALLAGGLALVPGEGSPAPREFTLVYNVNASGYVDVCGCKHKELRQGSLTRRAAFLRQIRATGRKVLLLDGGSSLFPIEDRVKDADMPEAVRQARLLVEAYNRMGYDALAVGSFDLAAGIESLRDLAKRARFPFLSANLVEKASGKPYFRPSTVVEVGGVRVGIIGLTQETMGSYYLERVASGAEVTDPVAAARTCLEDLRGKVDLVVALSHLQEETNEKLAKELPEIEIIVDPCIQLRNHHTWIDEKEWVSSLGDTLRLRSDGQGARMGVLDIELAAPRAKLLSRARLDELRELAAADKLTVALEKERDSFAGKSLFEFWRISLELHFGTDPEVESMVAAWKAKGDPAGVPPLVDPLPGRKDFLAVEGCKDCHTKQHDFWLKTRHAEAMATLVESGDEMAFDCLGCHTLGYGAAYLSPADAGSFANVQCESCHGTKPDHVGDPENHRFGRVKNDACVKCHNPEVLGKPFDVSRTRSQVACPGD